MRTGAVSKNLAAPSGAGEVRKSPLFRSDDEALAFEERAAIREFDAGVPRAVAERLAWADVLSARVLNQHQTISQAS